GNGSRQRHSSPSSLASGSSTDETGPPHRIPDSPTPRTRRDWGVHSRYDRSLIVATRSSLVPPCDFGRLTKTAVSGPSRMW
ncbi:hypothetical protein CN210_31590, partial [Sinorhizobium meliloti]